MTCETIYIATFANTLVTGGQKFTEFSYTKEEDPLEENIVTLKLGEHHTLEENQVVRIENLGKNGQSSWNNYHFQNGGEISGPGRIALMDKKTKDLIKWGTFKSDLFRILGMLAMTIIGTGILFSVFAITDDSIKDGPDLVIGGTIIMSFAYIVVTAVMLQTYIAARRNSFSGTNGYKEKIVSRFCTNTSLSAN
jgi:hypothetical protein